MSYIRISDGFKPLHSSCYNKFDPTPDEYIHYIVSSYATSLCIKSVLANMKAPK